MKLPKVYLIGHTKIDWDTLELYLKDTGNEEFLDSIDQAHVDGCSNFEILCSFYAKLCYKSLRLGENKNVTKIRDIKNNFQGVVDSGHGSVLEHINFNFVITGCSRVFTHELVRHRVGTAFSQTSGRYVALDEIDIVLPPELEEVYFDQPPEIGGKQMKEKWSVADDMRLLSDEISVRAGIWRDMLIKPGMSFTDKKRLTSAMRRLAPNGQTNEIGFSVNLRSLRHILLMRTNRHAEWEIRYVFDQVYKIFKNRYPNLLYGLKCEEVEGLVEIIGV